MKLLSAVGHELLVAQAIPLYVMNCFLLPRFFCDDLNKMVARFWWGGSDDERKIYWLSWERLCSTKCDGGLGFQNMYAFNLALLPKKIWCILQEPTSLVARLLQAKYYPNSMFLDATVKVGASFCWHSICAARVVLTCGSRWQVRSGEGIRIWEDRWIPQPSSLRVFSPKPVGTNKVCSVPLSIRKPNDCLIWHFDKKKKGEFSVKSGYHVALEWVLSHSRTAASSSESNPLGPLWKRIWAACVPPNVKVCAWRICRNIIPTRANLIKRHLKVDDGCVLYGARGESALHLIRDCPFAACVWMALPWGLHQKGTESLPWMIGPCCLPPP
ncbi:hypothetical protein FF1_038489 [Malus domestica]